MNEKKVGLLVLFFIATTAAEISNQHHQISLVFLLILNLSSLFIFFFTLIPGPCTVKAKKNQPE